MRRVLVLAILGCGRIGFAPELLPAPDGQVHDVCFAPKIELPMCASCGSPTPVAVALGDLDRDGLLDVVVGDESLGVLAVRRGLGGGALAAPTELAINYDAQDLVILDVDRDGLLDVVGASWNSRVYLFRGTGGGALAAGVSISQPSTPVAIGLADLDGDGDLDLVTAGEDNQVKVYLGAGDGTFGAATSLISAWNYYAVEITDVDGDGDLDLVTTDAFEQVTILRQVASLTWASIDVAVPGGPTGIASGDWNGDGHRDLAIAARPGRSSSCLATAAAWRSPGARS